MTPESAECRRARRLASYRSYNRSEKGRARNRRYKRSLPARITRSQRETRQRLAEPL